MAKKTRPPASSSTQLRRSALYDYHARRAAKLVVGGGGYLFPNSYSSPVEEHLNVRNNLGMQDLSSMGEIDVKGPGAERLLNYLAVNEIRDLYPGQIRYTTLCNDAGLIIDDVTIYKFAEEHFMVVSSSATRQTTFNWIREQSYGMSAYATDLSGAITFISVQGPRSREFLESLSDGIDFASLRFFRFGSAVINGTELILSRSGYTGELGYELYVPSDEAAILWEYLESEGKAFGLLPYGAEAMQSLRIEKALPLAGPDIWGEQSPFDLGLEKWIRFDKYDFMGRNALLDIQDRGLQSRWVGLVLDAELPARKGDAIHTIADIKAVREKMITGAEAGDYFDTEKASKTVVGKISSSARGHSLGKTLALGFVNVSHAYPGSRLMINLAGRPVLATVTNTPFFDPAGLRMRGKYPKSLQENR